MQDKASREWFALRNTVLTAQPRKGSEQPAGQLKPVRYHTRLTGNIELRDQNSLFISDAALDGVPLPADLQYANALDWTPWPLASSWVARAGAHALTSSSQTPGQEVRDERAVPVPAGAVLRGRIIGDLGTCWIVQGAGIAGRKLSGRFAFIGKSLWHLEPPAPPPEDTEILGYAFNDGGLNNQRMALLGLFQSAYQTKKPLLLPDIAVKNIAEKSDIPFPFQETFDLDSLLDFAERFGVKVIRAGTSHLPVGGWDYFGQGGQAFRRAAMQPAGSVAEVEDCRFTVEFAKSLRPASHLAAIISELQRVVLNEMRIELAAQFRIESDWALHSNGLLKNQVKEPEDFFLSYDRIAEKIAHSLSGQKRILAICDEAAVPVSKDEMKQVCLAKFGVELFFKSDFLPPDAAAELNALELSIIDFELAVSTKYFVGLTRSTFSNLVTFHKYARHGQDVETDYIYNCTGPALALRTDNGGSWAPGGATAKRVEALGLRP